MSAFVSLARCALAMGLGVVLAGQVGARAGAPLAAHPSAALPQFPALTAADRVLIVAPHPDDETLCCAGLMLRARAAGAHVAVVWLTKGDAFEFDVLVTERTLKVRGRRALQLGERRMEEGRSAAGRLGVEASAQYWLGYPDRGLTALLGSHYTLPLRSVYTRASSVQGAGVLHPGADYTGANLNRDLREVLERERPTLVLAAAPQDRHPDHAASGSLVASLLATRGELSQLRYWLVHDGREWPHPRHYHPDLPLLPPRGAAALAWQNLPLTWTEVQGKHAALLAYGTQLRVMAPYLLAFVRANELYARRRD